MAAPRVERTGLLILRLRLAESDSPTRLLTATITTTFDLSNRDEESETMVGSVDEVTAAARRFLVAFSDAAPSDDVLTKP